MYKIAYPFGAANAISIRQREYSWELTSDQRAGKICKRCAGGIYVYFREFGDFRCSTYDECKSDGYENYIHPRLKGNPVKWSEELPLVTISSSLKDLRI